MSFIMLEKIGQKWASNPSVVGLNWYSPNFEKYKTLAISNYLADLNLNEKNIKDFNLGVAIKNLTSPINRQINFIVAYRILKYYKTNPNLLKLIPYLHFTASKEVLGDNELFMVVNPDIRRFESKLPEDLKKIWNDFKKELE
jgi:hypothetical protein